MPNRRNGSKGGFEPGLSRLRVRHSTTELLRSTMGCVLGKDGQLLVKEVKAQGKERTRRSCFNFVDSQCKEGPTCMGNGGMWKEDW